MPTTSLTFCTVLAFIAASCSLIGNLNLFYKYICIIFIWTPSVLTCIHASYHLSFIPIGRHWSSPAQIHTTPQSGSWLFWLRFVTQPCHLSCRLTLWFWAAMHEGSGHWGSRFRCRLQSDQCPSKASPCVNTILHQVYQQQRHKTKELMAQGCLHPVYSNYK